MAFPYYSVAVFFLHGGDPGNPPRAPGTSRGAKPTSHGWLPLLTPRFMKVAAMKDEAARNPDLPDVSDLDVRELVLEVSTPLLAWHKKNDEIE